MALLVPAGAGGAVGALDYEGCISGEDLVLDDPCLLIPDAAPGGTDSGLDTVESVTVSDDGTSVYAVARADDSIARFKRSGSGALTYKGCISGDDSAGCRALDTASLNGGASGLDDLRALVVSHDGKSAYATAANDDAVARFHRKPSSGKLTFRGCISGETETGPTGSDACALLPSAAPSGTDSGLDHPKSLVLSADGKSLYVGSTEDAAIALFKRDTSNGKLTYQDCITGETQSGPTGSAACAETDEAGSSGNESGLDDPRGLVVARKGRFLLGVSSDDDALFVFDRDIQTGALTPDVCLSGETETVTAGACDGLTDTAGGADSGMDDTRSLAQSPDGKSIYVVSRFDSAIYHILRSEPPECWSADTGAAADSPCHSIGTPTAGGNNTGLGAAESVVISRDGRSLYVSAANDASIARFKRNTNTGALTFKGCISGETESAACEQIPSATSGGLDSGLDFPQFIAISRDGLSLYSSSGSDDAVASFRRNR